MASILLGACSASAANSDVQESPSNAARSAATAEALLTGLAPTSTPIPPTAAVSPTGESTLSSTQTATQSPLPTNRSQVVYSQPVCDMAGFVEDVSIPDGTDVEAGTTFTKTWRVRNDGTCTWNADYRVVFSDGDALGGPDSAEFVTEDIAPGDTIDVSIEFVAPDDPGNHTGYWKLENDEGGVFGIGASGSPFWVEIDIAEADATVTPTLTPTITEATSTPTEGNPSPTATPTEEVSPSATSSVEPDL